MCEFEIFHLWIVFHKPYMAQQITMLSLVIKFSTLRPLARQEFKLNSPNPGIDGYTDGELRAQYRFGRQSLLFITNLLTKDLQRITARNHALKPIDQVLVALRLFACGSFLFCLWMQVFPLLANLSRCSFLCTHSIQSVFNFCPYLIFSLICHTVF